MKLGIRSKLFMVSFGLITVSVVAADTYLARALDADLTERVQEDLFVRLRLVQGEAAGSDAPLDALERWDRLADDLAERGEARVTIVRSDGVVLGDSEVHAADLPSVENHAARPEIAQALAHGRGASTRWSSTVRQRMMYVAIPLQQGGITAGAVRMAKPLTEVNTALGALRRFVFASTGLALAVATLLTLLTSQWMAKTVRALTAAARRMAAGDLHVRTRATGTDELAELGRGLDQLASGLQGALGTLQKERDLMGRVLEGMQEGVLLLDQHGRVALANTALRSTLLLGAEVAGKSPLELIRNAALKKILDEAAASQHPVSAELETGDLKPRRVLVHASALPGVPKGVLAVFVDVTDLWRLETLRRDFVANVSHELRTPVASVRSAAETLRRAIETQPEAASEFVEIIERNAERLHQLIEDLLDLSRIESREFKLDIQSVELADVVERVLSIFRAPAEAKGVRLRSALGAGPVRVRADPRAVEQVLTNLVENAVKYCPAGTQVTVVARQAGSSVRVSVEDTGPGIEARHLPRIFERFYRADPGRSRELGGTGLGLSIVKHLVEAMDGQVSVDSTPGKGSRFSFTVQPG